MSNIVSVNINNYREEVSQSKIPVLVDFYAPWCGPCRQLNPVLEDIASENLDKFKIVKINIDEAIDLVTLFRVRSVPSLFVVKDGEVVNKIFHATKNNILTALEN